MEIKFPPDIATPDEVLAWAEKQGVDLYTLRQNMLLTPTQRLEKHQRLLALRDDLKEVIESVCKMSPLPRHADSGISWSKP